MVRLRSLNLKTAIAGALIAGFVLMAAWPGLFTSTDPMACFLRDSLRPPSPGHPVGFDLQGCDLYARSIYGARTSLVIGGSVVALAGAVAVVAGALAGYFGGFVDTVVSRVSDVFFALPVVLGGLFFLTLLQNRGVAQVVAVLSVLGWPAMARLTRASVMATSQREFVLAARSLGASNARILLRHVIPNSLTSTVVYATLFIGVAIAAEATLSFMGAGLQLPAISWGLMIAGAQDRLHRAPHLLFPGALLSLAVLAFVLLGDGLRDAFDPRRP